MIKGFVQGQTLKLSQTKIVADSIDYLIAKFTFNGDDWTNMDKWMHLQKGESVYAVRLQDDKTQKEDHLNLGAGEWSIWLHGNLQEDGVVRERITTNICTIHVENSGALSGDALPELPASIGEQVMARMDVLEAQMGIAVTLPDASELEDGQVLTAMNGKWQAVEPQGANVVVDAELSETSETPVQHKVSTQVVQEAGEAMHELGAAIETMAPHLTPAVTASDDGKFLQVVGGTWQAVALTDVSVEGRDDMSLTNYVLMPGADYQAACDAIRAKTGKSEPIKSGELASEISGITGGGSGGSVEGVHTVTFMTEDGSSVLYERYVADGDDCADVVDRGLLEKPTKESTVQYNYTYLGWSLTSGGAADDSALADVKADRTVYAAFASAVRYYTITYYDGDTVLKTETLAYGSMPNYMPEKDGASFTGWTPALTTVTGDASYTAGWQEKVTFAGGSWADIAAISESGQAADYFKVGDTREIALADETITVAIAGFDHDDLADGSGKAGMSIVCMTVPNIANRWTANTSSLYMYQYEKSEVYGILNTWKSNLPAELSSVIKTVAKVCDASKDSNNTNTNTLDCDLWLLSAAELGRLNTTKYYVQLGTPYALFPTTTTSTTYLEDIPTVIKTGSSYKVEYWLRQTKRIGSNNALYAQSDGNDGRVTDSQLYNTSYAKYIRFGFCI